MRCVVCASDIPITSKVCPYCGHLVRPQDKVQEPMTLPLYTPKEKLRPAVDTDAESQADCVQYRKKSKCPLIAIIILSIFLIVSAIIGVHFFNLYQQANENYINYYNKYTDYAESARRLKFFDDNVVFITDADSGIYHIYQCDFRNYDWMGDRSVVEADGFKPCPKCHKE